MLRILAIAGSVRSASTNAALLRAAATVAPERITVEIHDELGELPIFNPDRTERLPPAAEHFRAQALAADAFLIASPEYAHGVPGGLKNALDWLVGWGEVAGMPVALFHASDYGGEHARSALAEILVTMSLRIIPEASFTVHLRGKTLAEATDILATSEVTKGLRNTLSIFADIIRTDSTKD